MGAQNSSLGYPLSDELTTPDGVGRYNVFERGMIYWTPTHGAHPVLEPVLLDWAAQGYERSTYGFPTGDPQDHGEYVSQPFEGGTLESLKREGLMGLALMGVTPYLEFPNAKLADEFFDRVEAGLEELPAETTATFRSARKKYGPCELWLNHPHARKSSDFGAVGFKPNTHCTEKVLKITHTNTLRYKYYNRWELVPNLRGSVDHNPEYKFKYNNPFPHQYITKDIEQDFNGDKSTWFIGITVGEITTSTGTYYARAYSTPVKVPCKVPRNER